MRRRRRAPAPLPPPAPPTDWTAREVPVARDDAQPVTTRLLERLRPEDVAAVEASMDENARALWDEVPEEARGRLVLCFGVWGHVPAVLERTGLVAFEPSDDVHAMARGPLASGGDYYSADLVIDALARGGGDIRGVRRALDFGCSSGRTVRALAAAYREVEWHGVDPNAAAVEWASTYLRDVRFSTSANVPPLDFPDGHFDLVYAISVWSHFAERAARAWLDEMCRVIAPGGHLVITVHGPQAIAYYGARGERPPEQLEAIALALHRRGFWYQNEFGDEGDHGVAHPEWGTAFMTPEWLLRMVTPSWHVTSYAVGRNEDNQDVVVLRRARC